jgi:TPR repeat
VPASEEISRQAPTPASKLARAVERYYQAVELDRADVDAWNNLGVVLAELGRTSEATTRAGNSTSDYRSLHLHRPRIGGDGHSGWCWLTALASISFQADKHSLAGRQPVTALAV